MRLNLPILDQLKYSDNILIAGAGGGFDVFCGLPIYFTLLEMGKTVHLANYSFSNLEVLKLTEPLTVLKDNQVAGAHGHVQHISPYYPEGYLTQWFKETRDEDITIWMLAKTGVAPLIENYTILIDHLGIDALILIDGGVDSLMRGDESAPGTMLEDSICLSAVNVIDIPVKIMTCLGFGAELEVSHYLALENMSSLIKDGAFYGNCSLTPQMDAYQQYETACRYVWEQSVHARSHINMRVVSATNGHFGNHHLYDDYHQRTVFVSPLMMLYWFFDANNVIERNLLKEYLLPTQTVDEAFDVLNMYRAKFDIRERGKIPY